MPEAKRACNAFCALIQLCGGAKVCVFCFSMRHQSRGPCLNEKSLTCLPPPGLSNLDGLASGLMASIQDNPPRSACPFVEDFAATTTATQTARGAGLGWLEWRQGSWQWRFGDVTTYVSWRRKRWRRARCAVVRESLCEGVRLHQRQ